MNFIITNKGNTENYQEMAWVLELVKKGELILNAICDSVESAQYLEEFIIIISNAALSMGEVTRYIENTIAISEASLSELHDSISKLPSAALPDSKQAIEPAILSELSTLMAVDKTHTTKDATVTWALEKGEGRDEDVHGQAESVMA
jgi:hypothetical protein